ncbi:hypothetical protein BC829DRAFT_446699 [Chytridium lagenaria]|nr:hypothetical protein BC829DRAFT_446699 [Chytridium lagenaria]
MDQNSDFLRNAVTECLLVANASKSCLGFPLLCRKLKSVVSDIPGIDTFPNEDENTFVIFAKIFLLDVSVSTKGEVEKVKLSYAADGADDGAEGSQVGNDGAERAMLSLLRAGKFAEFRQCLIALGFRDQYGKSAVDLYHIAAALQADLKEIARTESNYASSFNGPIAKDARILLWDGIDPAIAFWASMRTISMLDIASSEPSDLVAAGCNLCKISIESSEFESLFLPKALPQYLAPSLEAQECVPIQTLLSPGSLFQFQKPGGDYPSAKAAFTLHFSPKVILPTTIERAFQELTGFEKVVPFGTTVSYKTALEEEAAAFSRANNLPLSSGTF